MGNHGGGGIWENHVGGGTWGVYNMGDVIVGVKMWVIGL